MNRILLIICLGLASLVAKSQSSSPPDLNGTYLEDIKEELLREWPNNQTINLVFHGHSVPAGYFKTPIVNTLGSYPYQVLVQLKSLYPNAVINIINTSIGGENSESGEKRFVSEVLSYNPDLLFLDYALNDRRIGLEKAYKAWGSMIRKALNEEIKVILLTPSPDQNIDLLDSGSVLELHAKQIRYMAQEFDVGIIDSYNLFRNKVLSGDIISKYMSQVNHPNKKGHQLIADEIIKYFK